MRVEIAESAPVADRARAVSRYFKSMTGITQWLAECRPASRWSATLHTRLLNGPPVAAQINGRGAASLKK